MIWTAIVIAILLDLSILVQIARPPVTRGNQRWIRVCLAGLCAICSGSLVGAAISGSPWLLLPCVGAYWFHFWIVWGGNSHKADPLQTVEAPAWFRGNYGHCLDEDVQFTVYRPNTVQPLRWYTMLVFAHLSRRSPDAHEDEPDPIEQVEQRAKSILGKEAPDYQCTTQDSRVAIPREGQLTLAPFIPGIECNPPCKVFYWKEDVHWEEFRLRAPKEMDKRTVRGCVRVYCGAILLAEVTVTIRVDSGSTSRPESQSLAVDHAHPYRNIFASYSHQDTWVVEHCRNFAEAMGDRYLCDCVDLRAGEIWTARLATMIEEADVFQLFWSSNSMASDYVRKEWEHALSLHRRNFIRPIYWERPLPASPERNLPPEQLRRFHFQCIDVAGYTLRAEAKHDLTARAENSRVPAREPLRTLNGQTTRGRWRAQGGEPTRGTIGLVASAMVILVCAGTIVRPPRPSGWDRPMGGYPSFEAIARARAQARIRERGVDEEALWEIIARSFPSESGRQPAAPESSIPKLLLDTGRPDKAIPYLYQVLAVLETAAGTELDQAALHANLGEAARRIGEAEQTPADWDREAVAQWEKALAIYRTVEGTDQLQATLYIDIADVLRRTGKHEEAIAGWNEALAIYRAIRGSEQQQATCHARIGETLQQIGRNQEAVAESERALVAFQAIGGTESGQAACYANIGKALEHMDKHEEAIATWDQALALYKTVESSDREQAALYSSIADALRKMGKREEAIARWDQALAMYSKIRGTGAQRAVCRASINDVLREMGESPRIATHDWPEFDANNLIVIPVSRKWDKADYARYIPILDDRIQRDPQDHKTYQERAYAYAQLGRYAEAIADYAKAMESAPDDARAYLYRGEAYSRMGERNLALADFARAIDLDPDFGPAYRNLGQLMAAVGDFRAAIQQYDKAITVDPADSEALLLRGEAYSARGFFDEAIRDYTQAMATYQTREAARLKRARAYMAKARREQAHRDRFTDGPTMGGVTMRMEVNDVGSSAANFADVLQALGDTVPANPTSAVDYTRRGMAWALKGNLDLAIADYDAAISVDPRYALAYDSRGNAFLDQGELSRAIADFSEAASIDSNVAFADGSGFTRFDPNDLRNAVDDLASLTGFDPNGVDVKILQGNAHKTRGEFTKAIAAYAEAIRVAPSLARQLIHSRLWIEPFLREEDGTGR